MTDIFVTGNKEDHELETLIKTRLKDNYTITYINDNRFIETGNGYNLIFYDSEKPDINVKNSILLMKEYGSIPMNLPNDITAIINSDDENQLMAIKEKKIKALTCGTSGKSTISFSSESEDTIVISLNRSITALSGKTIQPLEIPVEKREAGRYSLMSYTALRIILDDFNSELGKLI